jgi:hypothetical protein
VDQDFARGEVQDDVDFEAVVSCVSDSSLRHRLKSGAVNQTTPVVARSDIRWKWDRQAESSFWHETPLLSALPRTER